MEDRERELVVALGHEEVIWGQKAQVWLRAGITSAKSFLVCKWNI